MSKRKSTKTEKSTCNQTHPTRCAQDILRFRMSQLNVPDNMFGNDIEHKQLVDLIKRTALTGESNSLLVIGPRGSGKTVLMKSVLQELCKNEEISENLMQVHLHGLLQTDDRIALMEITRQLQLENTLGDKVFGSFSETLQFLLDALRAGSQTKSKSILFVLDEFDLFAHHKNQTLLYNLFDVSQSAQTPICVIGITCRLDVIELLEKRVKSRFSHRQLHLFNSLTYKDYVQMFVTLLTIPDDFPDKTYRKQWNNSIKELSDESTVRDILNRQYNINKDIRGLQSLLMHPVSKISSEHPHVTTSDIVDSMKILTQDAKSAMLHGISILELCLIIAMKHITDLYEGEPFNFEMVYKEYQKFSQRKSSLKMFEKAVILKAFEHLIALELIRPADGGGSRVQKEYRLMNLLVHSSQLMDALQKYPQCPTEVRQWASFTMTA